MVCCRDSHALARKRQRFTARLPYFRGKSRWHNACVKYSVRYNFWAITALAMTLLRMQAAQGVPGEIPFESHEGLLWVKATIPQSAEPLNLLLDTGAGASVINSGTADRLGLKFGS